jgi:hypothetical protein
LKEGVSPPYYFSYVRMMAEAMAEEDAVENEISFLFKAMMGELQTMPMDEADDEEEGEEEEG